MFLEFVQFAILIIYPVLINVFGKLPSLENKSRSIFYLKDIGIHSAILLLYFLFQHQSYEKLNFLEIGKGYKVNEDILNAIMSSFFFPIFIALFPNSPYLKDDSIYSCWSCFGRIIL
jgi:hypothetical protein